MARPKRETDDELFGDPSPESSSEVLPPEHSNIREVIEQTADFPVVSGDSRQLYCQQLLDLSLPRGTNRIANVAAFRQLLITLIEAL
jgi:hypothetical protein